MRIRLLTVFASLTLACSENQLSSLDFLAGTWKTEGKEKYEVWKKNENALSGYAYTFDNGEKKILETLSIKEIESRVVYEATVPDQNQGKTIAFILNPEDKSCFSFENKNHDFPKKIQYQKITDDKIKITVSGDGNSGFSYVQLRQEAGED